MNCTKLANTGHLTFTTLHSKDVKGTFERMAQEGVGKKDLMDSLSAIISQRLVPTLCTCKIKSDEEDLEFLDANKNIKTENKNNGVNSSFNIKNVNILPNGSTDIVLKENKYPTNCLVEIDGYDSSTPFLKCVSVIDYNIPETNVKIHIDNMFLKNQ